MSEAKHVNILLCGYYFQGNAGDDLLMESITATLGKYGEVKVTPEFDKDLLDWCDLLVIGGGSLITKKNVGGHDLALYAKEKGRKIVYYSQTVEEGHPYLKKHLALADIITVRDSVSRKIVEANGFRAVLAADPVFRKKRRTIGFSFRRWPEEPSGIEDRLAVILDNLAADYNILSVPFTHNDTDTESDTVFHEKIIQRMQNKPEHISYEESLKRIDLLLGMRLHALIGAVSEGKRVLAIDYDAKVGRIFSDLALDDCVVSYPELEHIPLIIRERIFGSDAAAQREKVNEAVIAKLCADIKGVPLPGVSVVMSSHNMAYYIKEAVDSILSQSMQDWELIIIDDGSTDNTARLVSAYSDKRISYYNFGHNGAGFSHNIGNILSRGKIIVLAEPCCVNLPDRLETVCREIEKTGAEIVYSSIRHLSAEGIREVAPCQPFSYEKLLEPGFLHHSTVAYLAEVGIKCRYNEDVMVSGDNHMYLQAADKGYRFHHIAEPLVMAVSQNGQAPFSDRQERPETGGKFVDSQPHNVPMVSVIIPTRNRPGFLKEALQSVLSQTYRNSEIIVINDGGEDVEEIINSLDDGGRIKYLQHIENRGPSAARNTGIKAAKGKYIAYLDDDDIYYPNHIETTVRFLEGGDCPAVYTDAYQAFQTWITDRYVTKEKKVTYDVDFDLQRLLICNYIHLSTFVHRKELFESAGLFDETLETHEDWELCIRLAQVSKFHHMKTITAEFRTRDDRTNATTTKNKSFLETLRIVYSRYSPLVTDPEVFKEQEKIEHGLEKEAELEEMSASIALYKDMHRYCLAEEFSKGKKVLLLNCPDNYVPVMLAGTAAEVVAINSGGKTSSQQYVGAGGNLCFIKGNFPHIPVAGEKLFDVIIYFGRPDEIKEADRFMKEIKRVLRDSGVLLSFISDKMNLDKFMVILDSNFKHIHTYGQDIYPASNIFPLFHSRLAAKEYVVEKGENGFVFISPQNKKVEHFICVSSNASVSDIPGNSYLTDVSKVFFKYRAAQVEFLEEGLKEKNAHIMNLEDAVKQKDAYIKDLVFSRGEKDKHIQNLEDAVRQKDKYILNLEDALRQKDGYIKDMVSSTGEKDKHILNLEDALRQKDGYIETLRSEVKLIKNSKGYRLLTKTGIIK